MKQMSVRRAATGWTTRMEERDDRVEDGREKSLLSVGAPKSVFESAKGSSVSV